MVAYVRGIRDYLAAVGNKAGKDELIAVLKKYASGTTDASVLENAAFPGFDPDGYLNLKTIEASIDWFTARGLLRGKPKLTDLADYQYLNYALERLGRREPAQKVQ
jgi:NitT/TauT family transport system substrate-binding protein